MQSEGDERQPGLKPALIAEGLRGPEGPLFHGGARIWGFFRDLLELVSWTGLREGGQFPQGLKPSVYAARSGTAEAVPCPKPTQNHYEARP